MPCVREYYCTLDNHEQHRQVSDFKAKTVVEYSFELWRRIKCLLLRISASPNLRNGQVVPPVPVISSGIWFK